MSSTESRLLSTIEHTFRRIKTERGHAPDIADIRDDLLPVLRFELVMLQLNEARRTPSDRSRRIMELTLELAALVLSHQKSDT